MLEYLEDGDLSNWRHTQWALEHPEEEIRYFACQMLQAFTFLHSIHVMHRDIKPANILLRRSSLWTEERSKSTLLAFNPVVADFGTATVPGLDSEDINDKAFLTFAGTLVFMAPEMSSMQRGPGKGYTFLSDVWSFGVLLLILFNGVRGIKPHLSAKQLLQECRSTMSPEFSNLLDNLLMERPEQRLTWDSMATHPWFKFPFSHAADWLESIEALPKCEAFMRPSRIESISMNSTDASFQTPHGKALLGLLDAKDLAKAQLKKLSILHAEWTTDKPRFHERYVRPWSELNRQIQSALPAYESLRTISTLRAIYELVLGSPSWPIASFIMLLQVGKELMERIQKFGHTSPNDPEYVRPSLQPAWIQLFKDVQTLLQRLDLSPSTENEALGSPVKLLAGEENGWECPFHAVMYLACVIKYEEVIALLVPLLPKMQESYDFLPAPKPQYTVEEIVNKLREIKAIVEYVYTVLPRTPISKSSSSGSLPASSASYAQQPLTNEQKCQDFIDRISTVIRNIPEEMQAIK